MQKIFSNYLHSLTAAALVLAILSGCGKLAGEQAAAPEKDASNNQAIEVTTIAAGERTLTDIVELSGTVIPEPNHSVRVTSLIAGVLDYVGPHVGDWVAKNQTVARLQDSMQLAMLHQSRAAFDLAQANRLKAEHGSRPQEIEQARELVEVARANALNAEQNKKRLQQLFDQEISAGRDYDLAVSQASVANSQLLAAQANLALVVKGPRLEDKLAAAAQSQQAAGVLEQSQDTLTLTQLRSPIKGIVAERYLDVGDQAGPTTPALLVIDPSVVYVQANLPVGYNDKLAPGQEATIFLPDSNLTLTGHVLKLGMKLDTATNTLPVQIEVENAALRLKFGMIVKARIAIEKHRALVIPKSCLIGSADDPNLLVVNLIKNHKSQPTAVQIGTTDGDYTEVKKGLQAGDQVATNVNYELPAGTAVLTK